MYNNLLNMLENNNKLASQGEVMPERLKLSSLTRLCLMKWYDGDICNQSPERIKRAFDILTWLHFHIDHSICQNSLEILAETYGRAAQDSWSLGKQELLRLYEERGSLLSLKEASGCRVIDFEGIDGSGKTYQINLLKEKLEGMGFRVALKSFPAYESFFGKELGTMLSGTGEARADRIDSKSMSLWYALDRWKDFQHFCPEDYDFLLLNRFTLSNAAYQSIRAGRDEKDIINWIFELEHIQLGLPVPDVYLIFDVSTDQSKKNVIKKGHRDYVGDKPDVYEESESLMEKARRRYLSISEKLHNAAVINSMLDDNAMRSGDDILSEILDILQNQGMLETKPCGKL